MKTVSLFLRYLMVIGLLLFFGVQTTGDFASVLGIVVGGFFLHLIFNLPEINYTTKLENELYEYQYHDQDNDQDNDQVELEKDVPEYFVDRLIDLLLKDYKNVKYGTIGILDTMYYLYEITDDIHVAIDYNRHWTTLYFLKTPYENAYDRFQSIDIRDTERASKLSRFVTKVRKYNEKKEFERDDQKVLKEVMKSLAPDEKEERRAKEYKELLTRQKELLNVNIRN